MQKVRNCTISGIRLEAVFDIVPHAESIADIGTDHGYLAVELIVRGKAKRVIAGDVHKGPLESAKSYIKSRGLSDVIDCRLGDGLQVTKKGELNGAICCGMGGFLMRDIVEEGPEPLDPHPVHVRPRPVHRECAVHLPHHEGPGQRADL